MPGKDPILIGIVGALLATFIGSHIGLYGEGRRAGFLTSVLGAMVLLAVCPLFKSKTA